MAEIIRHTKISVILSLAIVIAKVFVLGLSLFQSYKNFRYFPNNQSVMFRRIHVKYIPWKYLKPMLSTKQVSFCIVSDWEKGDAFENMFRRQRIYTNDFYVSIHSITELLYGQSWSSQGETQKMWKNYSDLIHKDSYAILVKSTAKKVADMVEESIPVGQNRIRIQRGVLGEISYFTNKQIDNWFLKQGNITLDKVNQLHMEYTFIKRDCFSFEHEVRCVVRDIDDEHREMLSFEIDPLSFFESFIIDYRLANQTRNQIEDDIISFGIDPNKIQSSIFL